MILGLIDFPVHCYPNCFSLFLFNGVTSVRDMASESKWILQMRQEIDEGISVGPRIFGLFSQEFMRFIQSFCINIDRQPKSCLYNLPSEVQFCGFFLKESENNLKINELEIKPVAHTNQKNERVTKPPDSPLE